MTTRPDPAAHAEACRVALARVHGLWRPEQGNYVLDELALTELVHDVVVATTPIISAAERARAVEVLRRTAITIQNSRPAPTPGQAQGFQDGSVAALLSMAERLEGLPQ